MQLYFLGRGRGAWSLAYSDFLGRYPENLRLNPEALHRKSRRLPRFLRASPRKSRRLPRNPEALPRKLGRLPRIQEALLRNLVHLYRILEALPRIFMDLPKNEEVPNLQIQTLNPYQVLFFPQF